MSGTQLNRAVGVLFIVFAVLIVVSVILSQIAVGDDVDPARDAIAESLADINDNEGAYLVGVAFDTASNVIGVALAAAVPYTSCSAAATGSWPWWRSPACSRRTSRS